MWLANILGKLTSAWTKAVQQSKDKPRENRSNFEICKISQPHREFCKRHALAPAKPLERER
jgi:hypothetical protein